MFYWNFQTKAHLLNIEKKLYLNQVFVYGAKIRLWFPFDYFLSVEIDMFPALLRISRQSSAAHIWNLVYTFELLKNMKKTYTIKCQVCDDFLVRVRLVGKGEQVWTMRL